MTPEQEARCDALARRIAELDPNWAREGMACRDRNRTVWRRVRHGWFDEDNGRVCSDNPLVQRQHVAFGRQNGQVDGFGYELLMPAIAAGPDFRDDATLGVLLLSLGDVVEIHYRDPRWHHADDRRWRVDSWMLLPALAPVADSTTLGPWCETRAEAILAANVAKMEEK